MKILETERLILRELNLGDAPFFLELVNEPAWLRFIGDRGITTIKAAQDYLLNGPIEMYRRLGFGTWLVERRAGSVPVGICGLLKRASLPDVDLGFAFLARHWRNGYATESAAATMVYGKNVLGLAKIVAVVSPENDASSRLLEKLGFTYARMTQLSEHAPQVKLYAAIL